MSVAKMVPLGLVLFKLNFSLEILTLSVEISSVPNIWQVERGVKLLTLKAFLKRMDNEQQCIKPHLKEKSFHTDTKFLL